MIGAVIALASSWSVAVWVKVPPAPEAVAAAVAAADPDEVIVNGERLRRARLRVRTDRKTGVATCSLKRPSGDPRLDAGLCAAALACDAPKVREAALQACLLPRVEAAIRARYPGRAIAPPVTPGPKG